MCVKRKSSKSDAKVRNRRAEPGWTIHPGEILREEFLSPLMMTPYELAKRLHVPVPRINDIVLEKRGITADTAVRLARFFGTSEQFWMGLQNTYEIRRARRALSTVLPKIEPRNSEPTE